MGDLKYFLKGNKKEKKTTMYAATKSLCDEKGNPVEWEIKALSTEDNERIREECTYEVQITGKPNMFRPKVDTRKLVSKMIAASVVYPNLNDAQLQDSYGVTTPEDLLVKMVDNPSEYNDFANFVQNYSGFDVDINAKVEEAKN
jgi:hypothetical protein